MRRRFGLSREDSSNVRQDTLCTGSYTREMEERSFCVYARGTPFIPRRITWSLLRLTPGTIIQPVSHSRSFFECPRNFVKDQFASVLPLSWLRRTPGNYFTRPCNVRPRHRSSLTLQCLSSASLLLPPISTGAVR